MTLERIGPYRVVRKVGEGGMGDVYEAVHETIERRVAVKLLRADLAKNAEAAARFINEARAVNIVEHPSIVQVSDYGHLPDGAAYIVMEFLRGVTLTEHIQHSGGRLPVPETLRITRQVASALAAAHAKDIIHRDLKPDNVMLVPDPDPDAPGRVRVKILDFGVAKVATATTRRPSQTRSAVVMGTPTYMSPEQCKDASRVDDKTDVYSLGVMLYEMLVGRPPFVSDSDTELMAKHMYESPPPLRTLALDIPQEVAQLAERLLTKTVAQRPSMAQVLEQFETLARRNDDLSQAGRIQVALSAAEISATLPPVDSIIPSSIPGLITVGGLPPVRISGAGSGPHQSSLTPAANAEEAAAQASSERARPATQMAVPMPPRGPAARPSLGVRMALAVAGIATLGMGIYVVRGLRSGKTASQLVSTLLPGKSTPPGSGQTATSRTDAAGSPAHPAATSIASTGDAARPVLPPAVEPPPSTTVHWSVITEPAGASIHRVDNGEVLGVTPWETQRPALAGALAVRLQLDGYEERLLALDLASDVSMHEKLKPRERDAHEHKEKSGDRHSSERRKSKRTSHEPVLED